MTKNYNASADLLIVAASKWHASATLRDQGRIAEAEEMAGQAAETALRAFSEESFDELALALNHFNRTSEEAAWDDDPRFAHDDMEDTTDTPNDGEQETDVSDQLASFGEKAGPEHDAVERDEESKDDDQDEEDEPSPDIMEGDGLDAEAQRDIQSEQNSPGEADRGGKVKPHGPRHEDEEEDDEDSEGAADDLTEEMDNDVGDDEGNSPPSSRRGGGFARGWRLTDEPGKGSMNYASLLGGVMESAARGRTIKKPSADERSTRLRRAAESRR